MKKLLLIVCICMAFAACKKETAATDAKKTDTASTACAKPKKKFKMYEMSELAALMEQMYAENEQLKQRIIKGDTVGSFPQQIIKIHSAAMTDESDRDAFFKENAANFIKAQELIYKDPKNAKQHFNDAVSACIQCHEGKCGGPIPRIEKLYIK